MREGIVARPVWGRGFRPFFLLGALYAASGVAVWLAVLAGWVSGPMWLAASLWHGHEMIFGVVAAAVAGFLLTSVPVWTGSQAIAGGRLAALAGLWLAGRVAMAAAGKLPPGLVAAIDLAFLPALAIAVARPLFTTGQRRNWGIVAILLVLLGVNLAMHAEALGLARPVAARALRVAVDLIVVLITIIGGRITPSFTAAALRRAGVDAPVRSLPWLDATAIAAVVAVAVLDATLPRTVYSGSAALLAAAAVAARMAGWQTRRALGDPLLWSLHLGYAWIPAGLLLVALADLGAAVPAAAGLHGLTSGAMGAMILAVMTRVALGHTGRPLHAPGAAVAAYCLVNAGALVRTTSPILWPSAYLTALAIAGALWAGAFLLYALHYGPILWSPRVDGKPG